MVVGAPVGVRVDGVGAMGRDCVTVLLASGAVELERHEWRALLEQGQRLGGSVVLTAPLGAAGASLPLELDEIERLALLGMITIWREAADAPPVPENVLALRRALLAGFDSTRAD